MGPSIGFHLYVHCVPVASLAGVVSVEGDGCLQVGEGEGAHQGTQAQVRRGEHRLGTRARDVRHRGRHV